MSTDLTYAEVNHPSREKFVASDKDEIEWVLGKVLQYAQQEGQTMYVIQRGGFYWMTDYPPEFKKRVATVYSGGRILYYRGRDCKVDPH